MSLKNNDKEKMPKTFEELTRQIIDDFRYFAQKEPEATIQMLSKNIVKKDEEIEKLKLENINKQSKIDSLEGQISVYRSFLKGEE